MMGELIRRCTPDDAGAIAEIYGPIVAHTVISFEEVPPGADEMRRRIAAAGNEFPWLLLEQAGVVAGYVYAAAHRSRAAYQWSVDVSAYVAPAAQRRGIARRLYGELFRILRGQGYCGAFAGVALPNEPSCKLHGSVGFTPVGVYHAVGYKHGAWHDVLWFERRLRPRDEAPSALLPLDAL